MLVKLNYRKNFVEKSKTKVHRHKESELELNKDLNALFQGITDKGDFINIVGEQKRIGNFGEVKQYQVKMLKKDVRTKISFFGPLHPIDYLLIKT